MRVLFVLLLATAALADEDEIVRAILGEAAAPYKAAIQRLHEEPALRQALLPRLGKLAWDAPRMPRRIATIQALGALGPKAKPVLPELLRATGDLKRKVRVAALAAIEAVGADATCVPSLRKLMADSNQQVRFHAVRALISMEPAVVGKPPLDFVALLEDSNSSVRWAALGRIAAFAPPHASVEDGVLTACSDRLAHVRTAALRAAVALQLPTERVLPLLAAALSARDASTRTVATEGLLALAKSAPKEVDAALRLAARARDANVRASALAALKKLHPRPGAIDDELRAARKALADERNREHVNRILRRAGGDRDTAVVMLLGELADEDGDTRSVATYDLRHLRVRDQSVKDALLRAAKRDPEVDVRQGAIWALAEFPDVTATQMAPFLRDGDDDVARAAAAALVKRGKGAVVLFAEGLLDDRPGVRAIAAEGLGKLKKTAAAAVPVLRAALKDKDEVVREQVELALFRITGE